MKTLEGCNYRLLSVLINLLIIFSIKTLKTWTQSDSSSLHLLHHDLWLTNSLKPKDTQFPGRITLAKLQTVGYFFLKNYYQNSYYQKVFFCVVQQSVFIFKSVNSTEHTTNSCQTAGHAAFLSRSRFYFCRAALHKNWMDNSFWLSSSGFTELKRWFAVGQRCKFTCQSSPRCTSPFLKNWLISV